MNEENKAVEPASVDELVKVTGQLRILHTDEHGNVKEDRTVKNLVVTTGKTHIASRLAGTSSGVMSHMEVGTSSQAAVVGDTTLVAAVAGSRTALGSITAGVPTANAVRHICTFGAGVGTGALTEAGLFNASSAGSMLARTLFSVINKSAGDSIVISWDLTIS